MCSSSSCQVRVLAASPPQLVEAFRLRYEVYRQLGYVTVGDAELDVDEYDERALPLGAFDVSTQELVGTMRIIRAESRSDYRCAVRRVVAQADDAALTARVIGRRSPTLPSAVSLEIGQMLVAIAGGLPICELSRLIVRPDRRGSGLSSLLIEAGMALAWHSGPALLVGGCLAGHVPMYARYGFRLLRSNDREDYFASVGQVARVVVCCPDDVPEPTRSRVQRMAQNIFEGECHD